MKFFLMLFFFFASGLEAGDLWVRALYCRSTADGVPYASISPGVAGGIFTSPQLRTINPYSQWGFEGGGGWNSICNTDIKLRGLWIRSTHSFATRVNEVSGIVPGLLPFNPGETVIGIGLLKNQLRDQYWNIRLQSGKSFCAQPQLLLRVSCGGRYANLSQRARSMADLFSVAGFAGQFLGSGELDFKYSGGGIESTIAAHWLPFWGLKLSTEIGGAVLIGRSTTRLRATNNDIGDALFTMTPATLIVPGLDASLELAYSGLHWHLAAGYLLQHYWGTFRTWNVVPGVASFSLSRRTDAGIAGPYLSAGIEF